MTEKLELKDKGGKYQEDDLAILNFFGAKLDRLAKKQIPVAEPPRLEGLQGILRMTNHHLWQIARVFFYAPVMFVLNLLPVYLIHISLSGTAEVPFSLVLLSVAGAVAGIYFSQKQIFQ